MSFADHYSLEAFRNDQQVDAAGNRSRGPQKTDSTKEAMASFVAELVAANRLPRVQGTRGRRINIADAWNAHIDGTKPDSHWALLNRLALFPKLCTLDILVTRPDRSFDRPLNEAELVAAYELLCKRMDEGNLVAGHSTIFDQLCDTKTGDTVQIQVINWQPTLLRLDETNYNWVPAHNVGLPALACEGFDVPSGRLLLTDFLRVDGIANATDDDENDIGSDNGQLATTKVLAAKHNMAYCQTENTSVAVFRVPNTGALAIYERYDPRTQNTIAFDDLEYLGDFSCDIWRITALDIATARKLAAAGGNSNPAAVDEYLALADQPNVWPSERPWAEVLPDHHDQCYSRNVLKVDVTPGRWEIHCGSGFSKRANRKRFGLPKGGKLWCVLTPAESKAA